MNPCRIEGWENEERARRELEGSAMTVVEAVRAEPENVRARLCADLFVRLLGPEAPALLGEVRTSLLLDVARSREEGFLHLAAGLWRRLKQLGALNEARGSALAEVLGELIGAPGVLFAFAYEAQSSGLRPTARHLNAALDRRFPDFRAQADRWVIDRELLVSVGIELDHLDHEFHPNGHLRHLRPRGAMAGAPVLELEERPGRGRYGETGKQGGYGFIVDERYEGGQVTGTLNSPWHDGETYANPKPWLVWVLECAAEIAGHRPAPKVAGGKSKSTRGRRRGGANASAGR